MILSIAARASQNRLSLAILAASVRGIRLRTLPGRDRSGKIQRDQPSEIDRLSSAVEDPHPSEFLAFWMRIATSDKLDSERTRKFKRPYAGAKGVGRFAVRLLGHSLRLETTAYDTKRRQNTRLLADFDWRKFTSGVDLSQVVVPYKVENPEAKSDTGTLLTITRLQEKWDRVWFPS
jgi:hypothetical protein